MMHTITKCQNPKTRLFYTARIINFHQNPLFLLLHYKQQLIRTFATNKLANKNVAVESQAQPQSATSYELQFVAGLRNQHLELVRHVLKLQLYSVKFQWFLSIFGVCDTIKTQPGEGSPQEKSIIKNYFKLKTRLVCVVLLQRNFFYVRDIN